MKNSLILLKENLKYVIESQRFRFIILSLICINLFGTAYLAYNTNYIDGILTVVTNNYYVALLISLILTNAISTYEMFEKNSFYLIRFNNRSEYLKKLIQNIVAINIVVMILNLLLLLIGLNIFNGNGLIIETVDHYNLSNAAYVSFYLIRFVILVQIICVLSILILKLVNFKLVLILDIILILFIMVYPNPSPSPVEKIPDMFIFVGEYFRFHPYSNFAFEVLCSTIYISALVTVTWVLFKLSERFMKRVGI
jgi:hypothetical protein